MDIGMKQLVLNKNGETFIFRYQPGKETEVLDCLVESAQDQRVSFDWFDASVLSFRLTQNLVNQTDRIINKNAPKKAGLLK